ncbi:MAG TPA: hypothetical protein VJ867_04975, partial [Gemmatimonadaceae bacterium]|nr:hypothetical protein [Gemmatimonadaceae bacterium]
FTSLDLLRDWSLSVLTDDIVAEPPALQQPSWNFPSAMPAVDVAFALVPRVLQDGRQLSVQITAGGTTYMRFAVPAGRDALLQITGLNGRPMPAGMQLTVVRIK